MKVSNCVLALPTPERARRTSPPLCQDASLSPPTASDTRRATLISVTQKTRTLGGALDGCERQRCSNANRPFTLPYGRSHLRTPPTTDG